ncbi:MAG: pimeloyl-ACP methyl ester esterase BioH [Gammaproteobacteria bacterium]|nr:pimeloyl-ACP methyl ester esterase BioH [Gammaproteobacteria bacterium]
MSRTHARQAETTLHIEERGSGAPLVLLHGWGLNLRVWDGLARQLAPECRTLAVDLPGHGQSPWRFARNEGTLEQQAELIAAILPPRCTLLGWSLGGQIALRIASLWPQRVTRLVLIATTPRFVADASWPDALAPSVLEDFAARLEEDAPGTVADFLDLQTRGSAGAGQVLAALRKALLEHGLAADAALAAGLSILRTADLRAELGTIRQPTLVLAGQHDRIAPPAASRALASALPHGRYLELRRGAHAPFLSHPEWVATQLRAFLGEGS